MIRSGIVAIGLVLALSSVSATPAGASHHEPVIQVVTVQVAGGKLEEYRGAVKKLMGVLGRISPDARLRMWQATAAGANAGTVLVGVEYPNASAWAAGAPKIQADAEWQKIVAGLDELRTLAGTSIWRDVSPTTSPGKPGPVLVTTGVQVKPGKLDAYLERIGSFQNITERLGLQARMRVWHAELAGPDTGAVVVGVEYADLSAYVADQAKLAADAEWRKLLGGLDEIRTLAGRSLYREITP